LGNAPRFANGGSTIDILERFARARREFINSLELIRCPLVRTLPVFNVSGNP